MSRVSFIVDRFHVSTPFAEIEKDIRRRARKGKATPEETEAYVAEAKVCHESNQGLYNDVTIGRIRTTEAWQNGRVK